MNPWKDGQQPAPAPFSGKRLAHAALVHRSHRPNAASGPGRNLSGAPPVYRPDSWNSAQPKIASTPKVAGAPPVYRPTNVAIRAAVQPKTNMPPTPRASFPRPVPALVPATSVATNSKVAGAPP